MVTPLGRRELGHVGRPAITPGRDGLARRDVHYCRKQLCGQVCKAFGCRSRLCHVADARHYRRSQGQGKCQHGPSDDTCAPPGPPRLKDAGVVHGGILLLATIMWAAERTTASGAHPSTRAPRRQSHQGARCGVGTGPGVAAVAEGASRSSFRKPSPGVMTSLEPPCAKDSR